MEPLTTYHGNRIRPSHLPSSSILVAPAVILAKVKSSYLNLQRYKILNISVRSSSQLVRNSTTQEVRHAFTVVHLMTILGEKTP
jgi:hypothetical protein